MIIVLAGIDGAGKSTAGLLLAERLRAAARPAVFTMNRSGRRSITGWCDRRGIHPPLALLDAVETSIRCVNVLASHARAGPRAGVVVMDRYLYCQLALRHLRGLPAGRLLPFLLAVLPTPGLVVYFDVPADLAHARITRRAVDIETLEHLAGLDAAYRQLSVFPTFLVLDASRTPEQLVGDILQELGVSGVALR
ncbi:thymidylate kinase [Arthrobacter sp. L77]|uniref:thymidylate kinase n=1 Tax=Arthrobacter sp. L77 TaxID=1496689 RepID=UPI0005BC27FF|nr:thymidylate kinase [Arthrobacter sp. L77]